jgi:CrcB protein
MAGSALWPAVFVFLGAGVGAVLRWCFALWWNAAEPGMPWGTLVANLVGGLGVGLLLAFLGQAADAGWSEETVRAWRLFAVTGFLGGLTTFSTFSAEVMALISQSRWTEAAAWAAAQLVGSLLLTALGLWAGSQIAPWGVRPLA